MDGIQYQTDHQRMARSTASRSNPHSSRSYADALADDDDSNDRLDWLSDMHRIVRGLASRQDIPDEWWAGAGLSRAIDFDGSFD